ncbi:MAG: cell division protein SepF, partial [Gordonibacter sp.]
AATAASAAAASAFDPYEAYAGSGSAAHSPSRSLSVLKPASYGEVEHVAKILKAGDAAVLSLRNTPDQLSKRILDFSFGVSSALDASVECIADKVFAITRGAALNDAERQALRNQGVL